MGASCQSSESSSGEERLGTGSGRAAEAIIGRMISLGSSVCIDAPAALVWNRLARLEDITLWSEAIVDAQCVEGRDRGIGAERTRRLTGGTTVCERWLAWDEGRSFTYEGVGVPLVSRARNTWTVQPEGERTLLTSEAEVSLKGGRLGRLLEPVVAIPIRRTGRRSLAAFKYLVEQGEPPRVRHAKLAPAPSVC
jgi:Polyketide cyclase / dehydrase and lipid transport